MAFIMKLNETRKGLVKLEKLLEETTSLYKQEGMTDKDALNILDGLSRATAPLSRELKTWLEDKQTRIEELEFLTGAFRLEYGSVLEYKKFSARIKNPDLKKRLMEFGKEETSHANQLAEFIFKYGGKPEYTFVSEEESEPLKPEEMLDDFIEQERAVIDYYVKGEERLQDAEFCWLIGKIKLEEKDHLKALSELKDEFKEKEIKLETDPRLKWVDPFMGEPGDRAWIE